MPRKRDSNPSSEAIRKRRWRAEQKAKRLHQEALQTLSSSAPPGVTPASFESLAPVEPPLPDPPLDPAAALVEWAEETLIVPAGLLAGEPFHIPEWQRAFLTRAMAPGVGQAGLSVSRKNGKSGLVAVWLLGHLAGPLRRARWRGAVVSLTGNHARELRDAMAELIDASRLPHVEVLVTPFPGRIRGPHGSRVDFLSADKATGHAIGVDLAIIDEAGLLEESQRSLVNALLTSTSARNGRMVAISIRGTSPMFGEMKQLSIDKPGEAIWEEYAAPVGCDLDDEEAWHRANPGLASGIKSLEYMRRQSSRAISVPKNAAEFRAYDLNQPGAPTHETIVSVEEWHRTAVAELPDERPGPVFLGVDLGGSESMSACVAYFPQIGIIEGVCAVPHEPTLEQRGLDDGVGDLYVECEEAGYLYQFGHRFVDAMQFLRFVYTGYNHRGYHIVAVGADRYRSDEFLAAGRKLGITATPYLRGVSAGAGAEASVDVEMFRRANMEGRLRHNGNPLALEAIKNAEVVTDSNGYYRLRRYPGRGPCDWLSAAVIAVGGAEQYYRTYGG